MTWRLFVGNMVSLACIVGATFLASVGAEGWGWLILAAILTHVSPG